MTRSVERERTWLVRQLPAGLSSGTPILQGYLAHDGAVAVRVRRRGDRHITTVTGVGGRSRIEIEWDLTREQFEALWPLTEGRRLDKVRHEVAVPGGTAEVDVFGGELAGLVLVEVEFDDDAAMHAFDAPTWFGPEVSDDPRYANGALARHGVPVDHPGGFPSPTR